MAFIINRVSEYHLITVKELTKLTYENTKVIHLITFKDCIFDCIDTSTYGFLDCKFINCLFNDYPENVKDSTFENCLTIEDRLENVSRIYEFSQMLNKEPKDDINETKEEGL